MGFKEYWGMQFAKPHGIGGKIATLLMKYLNKKMLLSVIDNIKDNTSVLDIGFGNGYVLKQLLKKSNSAFFGVDISKDMVKVALKKNKKNVELGRLKLVEASAENIPFNQTFGQIYTLTFVGSNPAAPAKHTIYCGTLKE